MKVLLDTSIIIEREAMMKVKDLITELQKYDPEFLVLVSGYEGDYEEEIEVYQIDVHPHDHAYFGSHEKWEDYEKRTEPNEPFQSAVIVARN